MKLERLVTRAWYGNQAWTKLLQPLSKIYSREFEKRKQQSLAHRRAPFVVPVVVVGNITVGGTGKTPLIIYLANQLQSRNMKVGVVSRGYGGEPPQSPYLVKLDDAPAICGDEPKLIAESTGAPVAIGADRCAAVEMLVEQGVSIVLSDDGLQHYDLPREFEIAVIDGARGLGNGCLLPAGPLREPPERLASVDCVLSNGELDPNYDEIAVDGCFRLVPANWINVQSGARVPLDFLSPSSSLSSVQQQYAVAGIGNPERFFSALRELDLAFTEKAFPDHHSFQKSDFAFLPSIETATVFMTAKDALKCADFAGPNFWALDVQIEFGEDKAGKDLGQSLVDSILALRNLG